MKLSYLARWVSSRKLFKAFLLSLYFPPPPYTPGRTLLDLHRIAEAFLSDFRKLNEERFQNGDVFLFHSIFPYTFSAIVDWTTELLQHKKIITTFFFQFSPSEKKSQVSWLKRLYYVGRRILKGERPSGSAMEWVDNNYVRFYQQKINILKKLVDKSHLLMASTDVLSKNFSGLFSLNVHYLPMPGENIPDSVRTLNVEKNRKIKVGYFGHSALEKGGQFLRFLAEKTLKNFSNVEFILHINPNADTESHLQYFRENPHPHITCYYGHLEQAKIMGLLKEVDIILMPYSPVKYATMPSAIFTEGMPLKKIFVLPKNTWAYSEAKKYDAGIAAFEKYNQDAILSALFKAIDQFAFLYKKSQMAGELFYAENNMTNYVDVFENVLKQVR